MALSTKRQANGNFLAVAEGQPPPRVDGSINDARGSATRLPRCSALNRRV